MRAKYGIKRTASVITIVGPTIERKGQKLFVDAALELLKRHPEAELEFFIVGTREGSYLQEIKDKINNSKYSNHFHLVEEEENQPRVIRTCGFLMFVFRVQPKKHFQLAILEAMAFKKAVIGTRVFSTNEIIQDGDNGFLVNPNDLNRSC